MWKKTALALLAVFALALAYVRPVYEVSVGGTALAGSWSGGDIAGAQVLAESAAEELSRGGAEVPEPETSMRLSILPAGGDAVTLAKELLAGTDGVQRAWDVTVDGIDIGRTGDATALDEAVLTYIAESAPANCISAGLVSRLELSEVYVPEGRVDDVMAISRRLRELTRVSYTLGDGRTVYG